MKPAAFCRLEFGANDKAASYLRDAHRIPFKSGQQSLLVVDGDEVRGCVIFYAVSVNDIEIGMFGEGILSRRIIRFIGTYAFIDNGCKRITARTHSLNSKARQTLERCGFKEEGRQRRFFDDGDAIIYGLLKDESELWRLAQSHGVFPAQ